MVGYDEKLMPMLTLDSLMPMPKLSWASAAVTKPKAIARAIRTRFMINSPIALVSSAYRE
jgi:hypothetical protein